MASLLDAPELQEYRNLIGPTAEDKRGAGLNALLALGLGLMGNRSPHFGVALGNAGFGAMNTHAGSLDLARQGRQADVQGALGLRKLRTDLAQEAALKELGEKWVLQQPVEKQPEARMMIAANPKALTDALAGNMFPKTEAFTLSPGAKRYGPGGQVIAEAPLTPEYKEGFRIDPNKDTITGVPEWLAARQKHAAAGAANIGVKVDARTGESLASQVGPIVKGTYDAAVASTKLVDASNRIIQAAETGNLYAGPTANLRLKAAQAADVFGIAGKDTLDKIKNTRQVIRGMAEQAVQARSQLGGQAQISNAEQELLNRATSGDIGDLTVGEVIDIAKTSKKLGVQVYKSHQEKLKVLDSKPELRGLRDFYQPPPLPNEGGGVLHPSLRDSTPEQITSDKDYNSLPSGTLFVGPDGKTRRKP
jgi:hypothetical protein